MVMGRESKVGNIFTHWRHVAARPAASAYQWCCTVFRLSKFYSSNIQCQACLALHHGLALRLGRQKRTSGNETNRVPRTDQLKITCKLGGPCQGLYLCGINVQLQACQAHKTYVHLVTTA